MFHLLALNRATPTTLAGRFSYLIDDIRLVLGYHIPRRPAEAPWLLQLVLYFERTRRRLIALLTRLQAGTLRPPRPRPPRPQIATEAAEPAQEPPSRPPRLRPPRLRLPRPRTWLLALLPPPPMVANPLAACREMLQHLLAEPEMAALIAASPQAGRVLRPLCHALGLGPDELPPALRLPPRPPRAPRPPDPARAAARAQARAEARADAAWARRFRRQIGLPAGPPKDALPIPAPDLARQARPPPKRR